MQLRGSVFFWFATRVTTPLALVVFALALLSETRYLQALPSPAIDVADVAEIDARRPSTAAAVPEPDRVEGVIRSGQTLAQAFADLGLTGEESHLASQELARFVDPRRVRPGDRYQAVLGPDGQVREFLYAMGGKGDARLTREAQSWQASFRAYERSVQTRRIEGTVRGSLEAALREAGGDPAVGYRMADVLQWDLDFNRDLQPGDRFETLYEEVFLDGEPHGMGNVLALRYHAGGKTLEAYRYGEGGYYDQEGRPLRKAFLKSPLQYSRVTSGFSQRRFHPVLRTYRPHWGVDFGAPVGTPVRVTANGVVLSAGWDGGGGKTVKVRHSGGYVTNYLHLSRFNTRAGARVSQGDVIGYVGQTGLASGPHLDYRVKRNGAWVNPTNLGGVEAEPITTTDLPLFRSERDELRSALVVHEPSAPTLPPTVMASEGSPQGGARVARR